MPARSELQGAVSEVFASAVLVLDVSDTDVSKSLRDYHSQISSAYENYELVVVDNGIMPSEFTELIALLKELPCIRVIRLAQPQSRDESIFAGLEAAIGDVVVVADVRFDPASDAVAVLAIAADSTADVVQGIVAKGAEAIAGRNGPGRRLFYWYNRRILKIRMDPSATGLTGLSRRAINILTSTTRSHRYLIHLLSYIGLPITRYPYKPSGVRTRHPSVTSAVGGAIEMISSYSMQPIRFVTALGAAAALANLLYAVWVIAVRILDEDVVEGWATTSLQTSLMFVIICIILAVMAEYLGRVLDEARREPGYAIAEERESDQLISNTSRRNVAS